MRLSVCLCGGPPGNLMVVLLTHSVLAGWVVPLRRLWHCLLAVGRGMVHLGGTTDLLEVLALRLPIGLNPPPLLQCHWRRAFNSCHAMVSLFHFLQCLAQVCLLHTADLSSCTRVCWEQQPLEHNPLFYMFPLAQVVQQGCC